MAGRQPEPPRGPFVCEFCAEVWPSVRALAGHIKAHSKGRAPQVPFPSVPLPPAVMPPFFLAPPPVLALGQPVAPAAGFFFGGLARRPLLEPRVQLVRQPQAAPPLRERDPVVSGAGGRIWMVVLDPNPAFWAPYRMGMDPPVELDFMGLRQLRRPESPSPSLASWINA